MDGLTHPGANDFRTFFENAPGLYLVLDRNLNIVAVTDAYARATKTVRDDIIGRHLFEVFPDNPDDPAATGVGNLHRSLLNVLATCAPDTMAVQKYDIRRPEEEGGGFEERFWSPLNAPVLGADGEVDFIIHRVEDVTEFVRLKQEGARRDERARELRSGFQRIEAEVYERAQEVQAANRRLEAANAELDLLRRQAEERTALLMATARDAKFLVGPDGRITEVNAEGERMLARAPGDIVGHTLKEFFPTIGMAHNLRLPRPGAQDAFVDIISPPVQIGDTDASLFVAREVTDRVKLEEQLRQSQKLEAIGQLTGGVAHDFNNLLTVIAATAEMLSDRLAEQEPEKKLVDMIDKAAERGSKLTHRMLAFARRQPLQPRSVDLNEIVGGMQLMLSRTLGEDVSVSINAAPDLWPVLVDPSQVEDALLNLAVNARDAMPKGGSLMIETSNVHFEQEDAELSRNLPAGDYVALIVSDTGQGMAPEIAARAIEPFFTTKGVGEGTGLGLSMVYGFVKQSLGDLVIYSEPGFGTSIKMFLPRGAASVEAASEPRRASGRRGAGEIILVVEDDPDVRAVAVALLEGLGYRTRAAPDGVSAMRELRDHADVDLLFTDLMMPGGMSGLDLLDAARRERPGLRGLLTSGYPAQMIEKRHAAPIGVALLGKPYRKRELAAAVARALDSGS